MKTGCSKNGSAYPTDNNYDRISRLPAKTINIALSTLSEMNAIPNPQLQQLLAPLCHGPSPIQKTVSVAPKVEDCGANESPKPYNCVKKALHAIYVSQK